MMPNTADIAAQAGVRAILEDWARRIDDDGTPSQIVSAEEIRAALAAIEPQAVAEPVVWRPMNIAPKDGTHILLRAINQTFEGKPVPDRVTVGNWWVDEGGTTEYRDLDGAYIGQDDNEPFEGWISWDGGFTKENAPDAWMPLPGVGSVPVTASDEGAVEVLTLTEIRRRVRNIWGAISSDQVVDKDVEGQAKRLLADIDAALSAAPKAQPVQGIASEKAADAEPRKRFPILSSQGQTVDYQLVADHGEQAYANHYQTVDRLAKRGGLAWCELYAVLHNRRYEKVDENEAITACRALEARYLADLSHPVQGWQDILTAPKDGTACVLLAMSGRAVVGHWHENSEAAQPWQGWSTDAGPLSSENAIGWTSLPAVMSAGEPTLESPLKKIADDMAAGSATFVSPKEDR